MKSPMEGRIIFRRQKITAHFKATGFVAVWKETAEVVDFKYAASPSWKRVLLEVKVAAEVAQRNRTRWKA